MVSREILTLQFGHYSNFVGTHFWNLQELSFDYTGSKNIEINNDVLYREGKTYKGETTYTPRLLVADLKGSLKTLSETGGLSDDIAEDGKVCEAFENINEPPLTKNKFLQDLDGSCLETHYELDSEVSTWTDFLYPRLHSRTLNIVNEYTQNDDKKGFEVACAGQNIWKSDYGEYFCDNIRKYVEESDSMQGFQIFFDCTDGFSGLSTECMEHLTDEYSKTILAYPIIASSFKDICDNHKTVSNLKDSIRLINLAFSINKLSDNSTLFVPLCTGENGWPKPGNPRLFAGLEYKPDLYYHSSALLASAIDTLSVCYRNKNSLITMSDVCSDMTGYGRKLAAASLQLPLHLSESQYLIDYLNEITKPISQSITPSCRIGTDKIFQMINVRGVPESYLKAPLNKAGNQANLPAYRCGNVKEMFELYFQANNYLSATSVSVSQNPLEIKTPFPKIFSNNLNKYGFVKSSSDIEDAVVESCPLISGYHNGTFIGDMLDKLYKDVRKVKFTKLHQFSQEGMEAAEYEEMLNNLAEFKDNYTDDFEL